MTGEPQCACQRCGKRIVFPIDLQNTEIECPHCHKLTTLLLPAPEHRVRKATPQLWQYLTVRNIRIAALIILGIVAAIGIRVHFNTINGELDRTGKMYAKPMGNYNKALSEAMSEGAKEAADFNAWMKNLTNNLTNQP